MRGVSCLSRGEITTASTACTSRLGRASVQWTLQIDRSACCLRLFIRRCSVNQWSHLDRYRSKVRRWPGAAAVVNLLAQRKQVYTRTLHPSRCERTQGKRECGLNLVFASGLFAYQAGRTLDINSEGHTARYAIYPCRFWVARFPRWKNTCLPSGVLLTVWVYRASAGRGDNCTHYPISRKSATQPMGPPLRALSRA